MTMEKPSQTLGNSREELYREIEKRLEKFHKETQSKEEFRFIHDLKKTNPEAGVYFVGGAVRDIILGKEPNDIDIVVNHVDSADLIKSVSGYGKLRFNLGYEDDIDKKSKEEQEELIQKARGVIHFKPENFTEDGEHIDIAYPRRDDHSQSGKSGIHGIKRDMQPVIDANMNIKEDLERRDFTFNAMAIDMSTGELIDEFGGLEDLLKKEVIMIGNPKERIEKEDTSRAFRAMRLAVELRADIDEDIMDSMRNITKPSEKSAYDIFTDSKQLKEALVYEQQIRDLFKIKAGQNMPIFLQTVWDEDKNKPQTATSRNDIENEAKKALRADPIKFLEILKDTGMLKVLLPEIEDLGQEDLRALQKKFASLSQDADFELKLAGLFYDLGKLDISDIQLISRRFNFSKGLTKDLVRLIYRADWFFKEINKINDVELEKVFIQDEKFGKNLVRLIKLNIGRLDKKGQEIGEKIFNRIEKLFKSQKKLKISGKDLIKMGYKPGPQISKAINELRALEIKRGKITEDDIQKVTKRIFY